MMGLGLQEGGRWHLTLGGMAGERPAFAETVAPPDVYAAIRDADPLTDLVVHRTPASVRRRYERLRRFPAWQLSAGGDLALPEIRGHRTPPTRVINRDIAHLHRAAQHDAKVAVAFARIAAHSTRHRRS